MDRQVGPGAQMQIAGVFFFPLRLIPTPGGPVLHLLRPDTVAPSQAGEVYFSEIEPGCVKAWKQHLRMTQRLAVPAGRALFALHDDRGDSPTRGTTVTFELGRPDMWGFLHIPPKVWYGFKGVSPCPALIVNCPDMAHDPQESLRIAADDPRLPWRWE